MLRTWQAECVSKALSKYASGDSHFLCQATPGSGKTIMAAQLAKELLDAKEIDFVLCFSPSLTVAEGIKRTFSWKLNCTFNGELGALGVSNTYQYIQHIDKSFWITMKKYRVFVVFDEIHHCSGGTNETANVWGEHILRIQNLAKYTLALTGTPWRSDLVPIAMSEYTDPDGMIICDFQYGLKEAIDDGVCRSPKIVLVDNEHLTVSQDSESKSFSSILELLRETSTPYLSVIQNTRAMTYILGLACDKLAEIRTNTPAAGGLIVAASVNHAKIIQSILTEQYKQSSVLVTYYQDSPLEDIDTFRGNKVEWIVSVGMISEGTDIPRLQVCCHLSSIKTELHFRQVLGRILRVTENDNQEAWLYTFAEKSLISFAERIEHSIPDACLFAKMTEASGLSDRPDDNSDDYFESTSKNKIAGQLLSFEWGRRTNSDFEENVSCHPFSREELRLGQFRVRIIAAFG
jgi:superfamily II DNA or RNA helicase